MKLIPFLLFVAISFSGMAQYKRIKKKVSYAEGTMFAYWGYNHSGYTNSNIKFQGPGYNFNLSGIKGTDKPSPFSANNYLNPLNVTTSQYNVRVGYYIRDHWALSFGYDHMKYVVQDMTTAFLSGQIDPETGDQWSGLYTGESVTLSRDHFMYENSAGLDYLRFELTRTDLWVKIGGRDQFAVSTNAGISLGALLSSNNFRFSGDTDYKTISMSGYGLSAHLGLRFEFFRHFFVQTGVSGGLQHQLKVHTRQLDSGSFAKQAYGYGAFETAIGVLLYVRPKNGCDSCPVW